MADHAAFTDLTGCPVYFCDPKSSWQRGANENTNRLLRQYLDKNGDISVHDQAALDRFAARLNGRPRRVLSWRTPAEVYAGLLGQDQSPLRTAALADATNTPSNSLALC